MYTTLLRYTYITEKTRLKFCWSSPHAAVHVILFFFLEAKKGGGANLRLRRTNFVQGAFDS